MSTTAALRLLAQLGVEHEVVEYEYVEGGGTSASSTALGVDEHQVIKTLVFEDDHKRPLIVLMHGDRQVSTKKLARCLGVKSVAPCKPEVADKHSGYRVGGTSPFATRKAMPIWAERSIADLETVYINGGRRGLLVKLSPRVILEVLQPNLVDIAQ